MVKLLQGDCLELMKDIPDKSIDMILCDPPFGTTRCKWDSIIPFDLKSQRSLFDKRLTNSLKLQMVYFLP